jgi:hypothetical protein
MTGFIGGFVAAVLLVAAIMCLVWALNELNDERRKAHDLEVKIATLEANRKSQSIDIK